MCMYALSRSVVLILAHMSINYIVCCDRFNKLFRSFAKPRKNTGYSVMANCTRFFMVQLARVMYQSVFPPSHLACLSKFVPQDGDDDLPPDFVWRVGEVPQRLIGRSKLIALSDTDLDLLHRFFLINCQVYANAFAVFGDGMFYLFLEVWSRYGCMYSVAIEAGRVNASEQKEPGLWDPRFDPAGVSLSPHERCSLKRQSLLVRKYAKASVGGRVFSSWNENYDYDSSAAWIRWISDDGSQHLSLGRIVYFLVESACEFVGCPQRQLARVDWFSTDPTGKYVSIDRHVISEFVSIGDIVPVSVCLLVHVLLSSKQRHSRVAYVRKRAKGPFMAVTLEHTRWGYEQQPQ